MKLPMIVFEYKSEGKWNKINLFSHSQQHNYFCLNLNVTQKCLQHAIVWQRRAALPVHSQQALIYVWNVF